MNVLISSAGRKVWLVRAFQEALGGTGRVFAADTSPNAAALHVADGRIIVPPSDQAAFVPTLLEFCRANEVRLLIPTRDGELELFARHAPEFEAVGVRVVVSPPEAIQVCQDKRRFHHFCVEHGFGMPALLEAPTVDDLPVFVRPRRGSGGAGARIVRRPADLAELPDDIICSEVVDAPEFTIDVFMDRTGRSISAVPRHRVQVAAGESQVTRTVEDPELAGRATELCSALGIVGPATVQAFRRGGQILFIEVNPRFGGASALSFAAGAPTPAWLVSEAAGEVLPSRLGDYERDLTLLRYGCDLFVRSEADDR